PAAAGGSATERMDPHRQGRTERHPGPHGRIHGRVQRRAGGRHPGALAVIARFRYRIPFARPLVTGAGTHTHREGLLLRYGLAPPYRYAEAAPLPGFSTETLDQVLACPLHEVPESLPSLRLAVDLLRWQ